MNNLREVLKSEVKGGILFGTLVALFITPFSPFTITTSQYHFEMFFFLLIHYKMKIFTTGFNYRFSMSLLFIFLDFTPLDFVPKDTKFMVLLTFF